MSGKKLTNFFSFSDASDDDDCVVLAAPTTRQLSEPVAIPGATEKGETTWKAAAQFCGDLFNESECRVIVKPDNPCYFRHDCKCASDVPYCSIRCAWRVCHWCQAKCCPICQPLNADLACSVCVGKTQETDESIVSSSAEHSRDAVATTSASNPVGPLEISSNSESQSYNDEEEEEEESVVDDSSLTLGSKDTDDEDEQENKEEVGRECCEKEYRRLKRKLDEVMLENELLKAKLEELSTQRGDKRRKHCFYVQMIY